jgi:PAS domain S-box-containing protein
VSRLAPTYDSGAPGATGGTAGSDARGSSPKSTRDEACILAVDDKPANLLALERVLAGIPVRIIKATSGEEALAASLRHRFALAILDVQMPGMDGYELAEILLADPATSRTPVIFVTAAYSDENHVFKGYTAGAVDYIVKPYNPSMLLAKVRVFLELAQHRQDLEVQVVDRTSELKASEGRFDDLFNLAPQALLMNDRTSRVVRGNRAAISVFGYQSDALEGRAVVDLLPAFVEHAPAGTIDPDRIAAVNSAPGAEWIAVRRDGTQLHTEVRLARVMLNGHEHVMASVTDVSARIAALEVIQRSLREKETLLKEIHHRVKNNLQIVSSLLRLQCEQCQEPEVRAPLQESIGRVRSMAMVHEQLYGHESLEEIDLGEYAQSLGSMLRGAHGPRARLSVQAEPLAVSIDVATPLGLILNELITNAFKHGLVRAEGDTRPRRTGDECDVLVEVRSMGGRVHLAVSDSGPGVAPLSHAQASNSLGMQLVRSLSRQLRADLRFDTEGGLRVSVECAVR